MTDYYAELNIDSSLGVDEINKELSKLENTWKRRELTSPEKATKMLALIIDARDVFKNTTTKNRYDRELAENKQQSKPVDPNQQRKDDIQKWRTDADRYYDSGEFDLARIAVDRALALVIDNSDDDLYALAASIYMEAGELNAAMTFINNAIVTNSQNGLYYLIKAGIYGRSANAAKFSDRYRATQYYEDVRKTLQIGLNITNSTGDIFAKSRLLGALAFSLYFEPAPDRVKAEELAKEALALGEDVGNAQKVIDAIEEQHRAEEQAAKERKEAEERAAKEQRRRDEEAAYRWEQERKEKIYKEALNISASASISEKQRAISQLETIIDYKDSRLRIESINDAIQYQKDQEANAAKKALYFKKCALIVALLVVTVIAVRFIVTTIITPASQRKEAIQMLSDGFYLDAVSMYNRLGDGQGDKLKEAMYLAASDVLASGDYRTAYVMFSCLRDYLDSHSLYCEARYADAKELMEDEYYYDAMYAFESLGDYSDSEARGLEAKYLYANKLYSEKNYEEAEMYFSELGTYADSVDMKALSTSGIQIAAIENADIGDIVTFGYYPQDNDYSNGDEELEWFVLAKEHNQILLFSVYGIDVMPFDADGREVSWHDCSLRAILNSLFYYSAFSDAQRGMIAETQTEDDTVDYVFIPSYSFMESYAKDYRSAEYTDYALSQGGRADTCIYTLRTPSDGWNGPSYRSTKGVWGSGSSCMYIDTGSACYIRPALWLQTSP